MLIKKLMGKKIIARSNQSGVWMGTLMDAKENEKEGYDVVLDDAIKCHGWSHTAATSGLACRGPGEGSRICDPVESSYVFGAFEILLITKEAEKRFDEIEKWNP